MADLRTTSKKDLRAVNLSDLTYNGLAIMDIYKNKLINEIIDYLEENERQYFEDFDLQECYFGYNKKEDNFIMGLDLNWSEIERDDYDDVLNAEYGNSNFTVSFKLNNNSELTNIKVDFYDGLFYNNEDCGFENLPKKTLHLRLD